MVFFMNIKAADRDLYMLKGPLSKKGYDWWWHSFTGIDSKTGKQKSFFIEYFIINPGLGSNKPVFGHQGANKPSYVMIKAGCWGEDAKQINNFYSINELKISKDTLDFSAGNCHLSENSMSGGVLLSQQDCTAHPEFMSDFGNMSWNLKINKKIAFNVGYGASKPFRMLNAFEMFWHAEGMKTEYDGTVILDGSKYIISSNNCFGYADKNWGSDFTSPWIWLSSCNLVSKISGKRLENSAFDIGGGKPKAFFIALDRKLLIDFYYEGNDFEFNFSKFWTRCKTVFNAFETDDSVVWEIVSESGTAAIEINISCKKKEMLLINYEAPNGLKLHNRLWNGGTGSGEIKLFRKVKNTKILIDEILAENIGCEYGEYGK
jgi:hypothetical protein